MDVDGECEDDTVVNDDNDAYDERLCAKEDKHEVKGHNPEVALVDEDVEAILEDCIANKRNTRT